MKKLLLVLVALGALAYGGVAFHSAQRAEELYHRTVHELAQHPDVRLLETDYARGWQRSHAVTSFEVLGPMGRVVGDRLRAAGVDGARHRVGFRLEHEIEHGPAALVDWARAGAKGSPVLAVVDTRIAFDRESEIDFKRAFGEPPALRARARVRRSGVGEIHVQAPARDLDARPSEPGDRRWAGRFAGLSGDFVFTSDGLSLAGSVESGGVSGGVGAERVEASGLTASFDLSRAAAGDPFEGRSELRAARLEPRGEAGPRLEDLHLVVEARRGGAGPSMRAIQLALGRWRTPGGAELGPGRMELVAHGGAVAALGLLVSPPAEEEVAADAEATPPTDAGAAQRALRALPGLSEEGADLELRALELATPDGPIEATGHLRADPLPPSLASVPGAALAALDARVDVRLPEPWLRGAAAELLRTRGLVRVSDGVAEARLELRGGVLRAHGEVVPLDVLLGAPALADASSPSAARAQGR